MRTLFLALVAFFLLSQPILAQTTQPVRGLIIKLIPLPPIDGVHATSSKTTASRMSKLVQNTGVAMKDSRDIGNGHHVMQLSEPLEGADLNAVLRRLRLNPDVESVEPDVRVQIQATPNDPDFALRQFHLQPPDVGRAAAVNMPLAWDITTGNNVTVAVLDTGVIRSHPELQGKLLPGYDFVSDAAFANDGSGRDNDPSDPGDWVTAAQANTAQFRGCAVKNSSWHGTFIAGQLAATTNNGVGIAGMNWQGSVLPVRISGKCGALVSDIVDGMRWAAGLPVAGVPTNATPARIVNLSFGGDAPCSNSRVYQDAIDEMARAGSLLVVAAGNESGPVRRPADCQGVLTVGAVAADGIKAPYANLGTAVTLTAPGGTTALPIHSIDNNGLTTPGGNGYGTKSGTSFSAPLAAGVASLMLSVNPSLTPAQLIARMRAGTRPHTTSAILPNCSDNSVSVQRDCNCTASTCGVGLLDARLALEQAMGPTVRIEPVPPQQPGTSITLDGRASTPAAASALVSYRWTQLSGPAVAIRDNMTALATIVPTQPGTLVFRLSVTDSVERTTFNDISVIVVAEGAAVANVAASSSSGSGGGASGFYWALALWLLVLWCWRKTGRPGGFA